MPAAGGPGVGVVRAARSPTRRAGEPGVSTGAGATLRRGPDGGAGPRGRAAALRPGPLSARASARGPRLDGRGGGGVRGRAAARSGPPRRRFRPRRSSGREASLEVAAHVHTTSTLAAALVRMPMLPEPEEAVWRTALLARVCPAAKFRAEVPGGVPSPGKSWRWPGAEPATTVTLSARARAVAAVGDDEHPIAGRGQGRTACGPGGKPRVEKPARGERVEVRRPGRGRDRRLRAALDHLEVGRLEAREGGVEEVVVPPRVVGPRDVQVGAVVGHDQAVGLHRLEDLPDRGRVAADVLRRLEPKPGPHRERARVGAVARGVGDREHVSLRVAGRSPSRLAALDPAGLGAGGGGDRVARKRRFCRYLSRPIRRAQAGAV
jgi:hypothetical protein